MKEEQSFKECSAEGYSKLRTLTGRLLDGPGYIFLN